MSLTRNASSESVEKTQVLRVQELYEQGSVLEGEAGYAACVSRTSLATPGYPTYAFVLDETTNITPPADVLGVAPEVHLVHLAELLLRSYLPQTDLPLRAVVEKVSESLARLMDESAKELGGDAYRNAMASLGVCRKVLRNEERWGILMLGDVSAIIEYANGVVEELNNPSRTRMRRLNNQVLGQMVHLARNSAVKDIFDTTVLLPVQKMLKSNRELANTAEGFWMLSRDQAAAANAARYEIPCSQVKSILLSTSGFNGLLLGLKPEELLLECKQPNGLHKIAELIREAESDDEAGELFPRFRRHAEMAATLILCQ